MDKLNENLIVSGLIHLLIGFCLKLKQHHRMFARVHLLTTLLVTEL